jgi:hypothetical protein
VQFERKAVDPVWRSWNVAKGDDLQKTGLSQPIEQQELASLKVVRSHDGDTDRGPRR